MKIDAQGYTLDKLDDILSAFETFLRGKYGDDFYIEAKSVIANIFTTVALMDEEIAIYLAKDLIPCEQHLDEDEFLNVEKHSLDELVSMIYESKIQDSKTICGLLTYKSKFNL